VRDPVVLVLTRKEGETIRIGDDVIVAVMEVRWSGVIFSVEAPSHTAVITPDARYLPKKKYPSRPAKEAR
jgi:hypothetical protein